MQIDKQKQSSEPTKGPCLAVASQGGSDQAKIKRKTRAQNGSNRGKESTQREEAEREPTSQVAWG